MWHPFWICKKKTTTVGTRIATHLSIVFPTVFLQGNGMSHQRHERGLGNNGPNYDKEVLHTFSVKDFFMIDIGQHGIYRPHKLLFLFLISNYPNCLRKSWKHLWFPWKCNGNWLRRSQVEADNSFQLLWKAAGFCKVTINFLRTSRIISVRLISMHINFSYCRISEFLFHVPPFTRLT